MDTQTRGIIRNDNTRKRPSGRAVTARVIMVSLLAVLVAARLGGGIVAASPLPACVVADADLNQAKADYAVTCSQPRIDCDNIDGLWYCSSEIIGERAPGGLTANDPDAAPPATPEPAPTTADTTPPPETPCVVSAAGLNQAKADYAAACSEPRVDCDKLDGLWFCSSEVIGDRAPGGLTGDGSIPVPPTPVPPTPVPPTPVPPTPVPPTPVPPTPVPPTPVPPTPVPPTPVPPTPVPPTPVPDGLHPDIVKVIEVEGRNPGGDGWKDSYSVGDQCYCATTFDHNIGGIVVDTPAGPKTVRQVCGEIGPGPGPLGRPIYNDIQCGNGPANDAGDEDDCPGRVDIGREGCGQIGPKWDLSIFE